MDSLYERLTAHIAGQVLRNEPLQKYTSYRLGGPADIFVAPASIEDIVVTKRFARETAVPVTVIGGGSNLLIADAGLRGVVMRIGRGLNRVEVDGRVITAETGVPFPRLASVARRHSLSGLEFAGGIPGTVGGALTMNAGAHADCVADVVRDVLVVDAEGQLITFTKDEMQFSYRMSRLQKRPELVAVQARFQLTPGPADDIRRDSRAYLDHRRKTQPLGTRNAGSVFKNPPGDFAGRLLEQAGCKGMSVGDAVVSELHSNFIVNRGEATAEDVRRLIKHVQQVVFERFGIRLEPEVRMLGFT